MKQYVERIKRGLINAIHTANDNMGLVVLVLVLLNLYTALITSFLYRSLMLALSSLCGIILTAGIHLLIITKEDENHD